MQLKDCVKIQHTNSDLKEKHQIEHVYMSSKGIIIVINYEGFTVIGVPIEGGYCYVEEDLSYPEALAKYNEIAREF